MSFRGWARLAALSLACAAWFATGCGWQVMEPDAAGQADVASDLEQVLGASPDRPPAATLLEDLEPNNDLSTAQFAPPAETTRIMGSIAGGATPLDRDAYDLGPVRAGDRVLVDLTISPGSDVVLGLLDGELRLLAHIDPSSPSAGPRQVDMTVRSPSESLYVVVGTRSLSSLSRGYVATVTLQRGAGTAAPRPQVLVLNFSGAAGVRIGGRSPVDVPPFDAAAISTAYSGQTETLINAILALVREDFAGLEVSVHHDGEVDATEGEFSTVYFGTYDSRLLGLADNVDPYNADLAQSAILFTDTFSVFNVLSPSLEQMAQALANTTSHEAGHLLGLRHTADPADLMDTTATARQMMLEQRFSLAELNTSVLPLGLQDAPWLLAWTLGGQLVPPSSSKSLPRVTQLKTPVAADDFYIPRAWLMSSCTAATPK